MQNAKFDAVGKNFRKYRVYGSRVRRRRDEGEVEGEVHEGRGGKQQPGNQGGNYGLT